MSRAKHNVVRKCVSVWKHPFIIYIIATIHGTPES